MPTKIEIILEAQNQASAAVRQVNADLAVLGTTAASANSQQVSSVNQVGLAAARTSTSMANLARTAQTTRQGMQALRGTMMLVGMQAFPQATMSIMAASSAMQAFRGVALLTGGSLTVIGAGAAGAAIHLWTLAEAFKAVAAVRQQFASEDAANETFERLRKQVVEQLDLAIKRRQLTAEEGVGLRNQLVNASTLADKYDRLTAAQRRLSDVTLSESQRGALITLGQIEGAVDASLAGGFEERRRRVLLQESDLLAEVNALTATSKREQGDLIAKIAADTRKKISALNDEEIAAENAAREQQRLAETAALQQIAALRDNLIVASLTGVDREIAAVNLRYDQEMTRLRELLATINLTEEETLQLLELLGQARAAEFRAAPAEVQQAELGGLRSEFASLDARGDLQGGRGVPAAQQVNLAAQAALLRDITAQIEAQQTALRDKLDLDEAELVTQRQWIELEQQRRDALLETDEVLRRSREMEKAVNQQRLTATTSMFNDMAEAARIYGKKGFAVYKGMATAAALIDTFRAAQGAYTATVGIPYVGPILAPIAAAAALAAGVARVAQINAQSFATGGFTGEGAANQVAGVVHAGEFVFNKKSVDRIGPAALAAMMHAGERGQAPAGFQTGGFAMPDMGNINFGERPASAETGPKNLKAAFHMHLDKQAWLDAVRDDIEGIALQAYDRNRATVAL